MGDSPAFPATQSLDARVRRSLAAWPQRPPGMPRNIKQPGTWLRARPDNWTKACQPFLKLPGSRHLRTLPDGLWVHFSHDPSDPFADILCIEACSSLTNLLDKRSRFAPSAGCLQVYCPLPWLLAPTLPETTIPRWRLIALFTTAPTGPVVLPVRDIRVVYGLQDEHYAGFCESQMPAAHEFFCPMEALMQPGGDQNPQMRALMARTSAAANFMCLPEDLPEQPLCPANDPLPAPAHKAPSPATGLRKRRASPPSMRFIDSLYG